MRTLSRREESPARGITKVRRTSYCFLGRLP
jgi:hypothetical protein